MEQFDIYKDIAERTNGDIYIGVVGPVRTGKSTFIKRFMDLLVIPNIENSYTKERARDELPQSASGKTIMTTEPKFVPNEAVRLNLDDNLSFNVRLIDCVGYLVPGAEGHFDGDSPRMINTPWSDKAMPFEEAAEIGTKKVINEHSTIGILVTTDGSITDIPRENYVNAETRVVEELQSINKPFVIILNTTSPYSTESESLRDEMVNTYGAPVIPLNCAQLKTDDITMILDEILYEFPVREILFSLPKWVETLDNDHWLKKDIIKSLKPVLSEINKFRETDKCIECFSDNENVKKAFIDNVFPGTGSVNIEVAMNDSLFYKVLSETTGLDINSDYELISMIKKLSDIKREYDKIEYAVGEVRRKGYGIVTPTFEDIKIDPPETFKQGSRYGIRIKARGESIHMIKADIESEVSPIIGNEEQSREFIADLIKDYETDPEKMWNLNIFGRTLENLVHEGMRNKIYRMPADAQVKLQETLQKIVNEGSGGLICIIL